MERVEFCKMLEDAKHESKMSTIDMVRVFNTYPNDIRRLERGINNSKMSTYMQYISAVKHAMAIDNNDETFVINDYPGLVQWALQAMGGGTGYSMAQNHKDVGFYQTYISFLKKPGHSMTIDKFLALVNKLGCEVRLVKAEG